MAIAGLHNVPLLESSLLRESQSSSSGRRSNRGSMSTRASSILQMWRELEDECAVSRARERGRPRLHQVRNDGLSAYREGEGSSGLEDLSKSENGSVINSESHIAPSVEQDDRESMTSEQSQDLGDVERERVRKIFREWMSSGGNVESPRSAHVSRSPRAQYPGENEHERVQIVRDWIQMNSPQREACSGNRENHAEMGSQIEHFQEGQVLDHNEGQPEIGRRKIRKLCGRQALLDLLAKKEQERRQELQCLEGTQPVSGFAHRNRIQSLLRLRCFQNLRSVELSRPSSARESELGLLRQRQTVSGLREGFLSRLDSNIHVQASDLSNSPSDNCEDVLREVQSHANTANEDLDGGHEQNDPANEVITGNHEPNDSVTVVVDKAHEQKDPDGDVGGPSTSLSGTESNVCSLVDSNRHMEYSTGGTDLRQCDSQVEARLCHDMDNAVEDRPVTCTSVRSMCSSEDGSPSMNFEELLRRESGELIVVDETPENFRGHATGIEEIDVNSELDDQFPASQNIDGLESSVVVEDWQEQVSEYQRDWEGSAISDQLRDFPVGTNETHSAGDGEDVSHGALESEGGEQNDAQEDYWHGNGSQETPREWLGMPSDSRLAPDRVDTYYYSDDENVNHMELRELVNRRRVSSLLHSDFRESLDQLIQSYVERQTNAPDDWELHEMLPPPFLQRNQEPLDMDQDESGSDDIQTGGREESLPPPPPPPPQEYWAQGLRQTTWARREISQRPGTEWEIINDLRIDVARLAQRMNNMQRMLEACMDMQVELQRSVRQEVSAALNRSVYPSEMPENLLPKDSFKWDCVRKGVCCICSNTNIDSLLYRCGHMCTCTKCADVLVQGNGKCPMCQAPITEVIRAYFIQ